MKLAAWILAEGITDTAAAIRIGVTPAALDRYKKGQRIPRPAIMARIARETAGKVTPNDFYDLRCDRRAPLTEEAA